MNKNENVVIAVFEDGPAAEAAIARLKQWDKASEDVKLGAIGLLYKEDGQVKTTVGHQTGRGLLVGAVVGVIAGVLTGGVGLIGGAAAGGLMGGALGSFFRQSLHLTEEECNALGTELDLGKAAVVVNVDEYEIVPTSRNLEHAGGVAKVYAIPKEAVDEAAAVLDEHRMREEQLLQEGLAEARTRASLDLGGML